MGDRGEADVLPLSEALVRWTDASLVEAVKAQERRLTAGQIAYVVHRPLLSRPLKLRRPSEHEWMMGPPDFQPLFAAWARLERDLVARFSQERLFVRGVQLRPCRGTRHEELPGVWAASFRMNFADNTITVDLELYGAIEVSRTAWPIRSANPARPDDVALPCAQPDIAEDAGDDIEPPASRRPGPGSFDGMIDQAMERHWDALSMAVVRRGKDKPNWSDLARVLRTQIQKQFRGEAEIGIPGHQAIRKRIAETYPEVLVRMSGKISLDQVSFGQINTDQIHALTAQGRITLRDPSHDRLCTSSSSPRSPDPSRSGYALADEPANVGALALAKDRSALPEARRPGRLPTRRD